MKNLYLIALAVFLTSAMPEIAHGNASTICLLSQGHPESGEGEMWRITEHPGQDTEVIRSMVFYYHRVPFELDGDVAVFNVIKSISTGMILYADADSASAQPFELMLFNDGNARIRISTRTILANKSNVGTDGCGTLRFN